jgi:hypothetical protein
MAKGRSTRSREEKKPKADKKAATSPTSFLRPQPVDAKTAAKDSKK